MDRPPFDVFELVGMAAALVAAAVVTRYALLAWPALDRPWASALFAAAAAAAGIAPFVLRRRRRAP